MHYHLTPVSSNVKTGPIPVSTSSRRTCPSSCPFQAKGCYADNGPLNIHWNKVTDQSRGVPFKEFLKLIQNLPRGQLWRYAQAGDLPGEDLEIDYDQLMALAKANRNRPVIVFTHKPPTEENLKAIRDARKLGFPINLSSNSIDQVDDYAQHDLPVVTVLHSDYERKSSKGEWTETLTDYKLRVANLPDTTPNGKKIVVCPATWTDTNCDRCRLCSHDRKGIVIGFPVHGTRKQKVNETVT